MRGVEAGSVIVYAAPVPVAPDVGSHTILPCTIFIKSKLLHYLISNATL